VELLERVVGQDGGVGPVGDLEDEGVAAADRPGRRGDDLARVDRGLVGVPLVAGDAVGERGVDDDGHDLRVVLAHVRLHGFVELRKAGRFPPFGRDVGAVHHEVGTDLGRLMWLILLGRSGRHLVKH
jgi:hypothetical protein